MGGAGEATVWRAATSVSGTGEAGVRSPVGVAVTPGVAPGIIPGPAFQPGGAGGRAHTAAPVLATSAVDARRTRERGGRPASRE
ncbi:hypothetical protein GCM10027161_61860 [Microbispora hainanensis]